ncbi:hypothetical protein [Muricoccus pecuniae]|uniref:Uncharacterized protein n=1 Tax=Muricoccus pecuniae TaxID=693023 RepID=A0A840Y585_9PROT|nr:hypothetical protein [Roseomonas pecuniae]MBB5696288.1 hypothetical protein [Roseomonas pecuniae]
MARQPEARRQRPEALQPAASASPAGTQELFCLTSSVLNSGTGPVTTAWTTR